MKLFLAFASVALLALISLFVGVLDMSPAQLAAGDAAAWGIFWAARLPRTLALLLAGLSMAIAGSIMQILTRNRFAEPSTAGTAESASLGLLCAMLFMPALPLFGKMLCAAAFALAGTALFMALIRSVRGVAAVPLIGLMLGGIIRAVTDFFAYRYDLLQSVLVWTSGDFSAITAGRYELLWLAAPVALLAYCAAHGFTAAGLGEDFAANIGLNYRIIILLGLAVIAVITALNVIIAGQIPFLGLIAPNIVALKIGDNQRRALPYAAALGAGLTLSCDIIGRIIRFPYEIPLSTMMGIIGSAVFLYLLFHGRRRFA